MKQKAAERLRTSEDPGNNDDNNKRHKHSDKIILSEKKSWVCWGLVGSGGGGALKASKVLG